MKKEILNIIKIGGKPLADKENLSVFLSDFAQLEGKKILVHGGGPKAAALSRQLGLEPQMIDGRRITDASTLEVVTMVYAGLINKQLVSQLQSQNCDAMGLSGADLNSIQAQKRAIQLVDFGYVGDIQKINSERICQLLEIGITPVFNAITHDGTGQLLNTNADTIAAYLAVGLATKFDVRLFYCFEQKGVLKSMEDVNDFYSNISKANFEDFKKSGQISGGMIPKLHNAYFALKHQVEQVWIGAATELKSIPHFKGTQICL